MIKWDIDPYDMLIQHNVRLKLLENQIQELQSQHRQDKQTIDQQQRVIAQLQQNETILSDAVGHLLLKVPK